jgi:hypothetical protein
VNMASTSDVEQLGPTRRAMISALVALKNAAPDAETRRIREQTLRCHRIANQLYRRHGRPDS